MLANGLSATRTGYFRMTRRSGSPAARAVTTYGLRSSSSRFARMMRISCAVPARPRIDRRDRQVLDQVPRLRQAPRRVGELAENSPPMFALK